MIDKTSLKWLCKQYRASGAFPTWHMDLKVASKHQQNNDYIEEYMEWVIETLGGVPGGGPGEGLCENSGDYYMLRTEYVRKLADAYGIR